MDLAKLSGAAVVVAICVTLGAGSAGADTIGPIDFEPATYTTGTIDGQDGWQSDGAAGSGCATYDHQITTTSSFPGAPASFDTQSLRISNAVTSGCFGDQTFSKPTVDEAGEPTALNGGLSGGTRQTEFEAQWDFWSTVPGAEQPGLSVVASPDRGDGARMSWIQMADAPGGLEVNFFDYTDNAPYGANGTESDGCDANDDFVLTPLATGLDRTLVHTIRVAIHFATGPRNDTVQVYVDGSLEITDTTWEDYYRWCEATDESRTVDSILFRTGGTAAPSTAGNGFLIDNLSYTTTSVPTAATLRSASAARSPAGVSVRWRTAAEAGLLGFDVYRVDGSRHVRVNRTLVRAAGAAVGHAYAVLDRAAPLRRALRYTLVAVRLDGRTAWTRTVAAR